jgi:hypothetical protein
MLHERSAMLNGLAMMWSDKAKPLDGDTFCWTGDTENRRMGGGSGVDGEKTDQDHIVNVLAAQINKDGVFKLENVMKAYEEWTRPEPTTAVDKETEDGGC